MTRTISTAELTKQREQRKLAIVDARPIAAYNGWRLRGEARGGHIPGAITFPLSWADLLDHDEAQSLLAAKGIVPQRTVVVYGDDAAAADAAARWLAQLGYDDVLAYREGLSAWAADAALPLRRLARYERLVHPQWIRDLSGGRPVTDYEGKRFVVAHVTFSVSEEFEQGHIPGAIHLDTNALEDERTWNRRTPAELEQALTAHGITADTTVVLYGRDSNPDMSQEHPGRKAGQIAATRAAAILMYAGVADVRLLDGGLDAWIAAGYPLATGWRDPAPVAAFGVAIPARPDYFVDLDEARQLLADPNGELVSIRSWHEFTGDTSGYHYIGPRGRIPGAIWGNGGSDAYHMQHYRNVDNTMRAYHEIAANWEAAGITPDKRIAFYCGTGWRASETFFYAYLLGWPRVAVYDGGWFEWSSDPDNPVETGIPARAGGVSVGA